MTDKPVMPQVAKVGVGLLVLDFLISSRSILSLLSGADLGSLEPGSLRAVPLIVATLLYLFFGLLVYLVATGRRWALILSVSIFVAGLLLMSLVVSVGPGDSDVHRNIAMGMVFNLIPVAGYVMLFSKPSRAWFADCGRWRKLRQSPAGA